MTADISLLKTAAMVPLKGVYRFPASFAQRRLWFINQLEPGSASYNVPTALRIEGSLDVKALDRSLQEIVRRHESLRTRFVAIQGEPQQVVDPDATIELQVTDLRVSSSDSFGAGSKAETDKDKWADESAARQLAEEESREPFDLGHGPLLRMRLLRIKVDEHVLLLTMHHIISDAWSLVILIEEVSLLYMAFTATRPSPLSELPIQYGDYSVWQREWLSGEVLEWQLGYWRKQLAGMKPWELPTDRPRPLLQSQRGASARFTISAEVTKKLMELSHRQGVTLYMTMLAAWEVVLYRHSGQQDLTIGTPIAGRTRTETQRLIGLFVNTLVLRGDLSGTPSFAQLLHRVKDRTLEAYAHQDVPFEKLVEELQPERDLSRSPLFPVMFGLQNAPKSELDLGEIKLLSLDMERGTSKFDLTLSLADSLGPAKEGMRGLLEYSTDLFERASIDRIIEHYQTLLEAVLSGTGCSIEEIPLMREEERRQLLVEWTTTQVEYGQEVCIHELFEAQVERTPRAVALVYEQRQMSYDEVNRRANQLAWYLRRLGVGPEKRVGIFLERGFETVVSLLAVLKAGGTYVAMDPVYPTERLNYIVADSTPVALLTQGHLAGLLLEISATVSVIDLGDASAWSRQPFTNPQRTSVGVTPENLAYVAYTSGSAGEPKGVAVEHKNAANLMYWAQALGGGTLERATFSTPLNAGVAVIKYFVPLTSGATVRIVPNALAPSRTLVDVTLINATPAAMNTLLEVSSIPKAVRVVNVWGEPLNRRLVERIFATTEVNRVCNFYGLSETSTCSTCVSIKRGEPFSGHIGRPISNTRIYILDAHGQPVPVGVAGELYIGGAGVARGYLKQPDLTAQHFQPDPFAEASGARMFRTRDLGRWLTDGTIELVGRDDFQMKIQGLRVELGEIETALMGHPKVRDAVVLVQDDGTGKKQLVAYLVSHTEIITGELQELVRQSVPGYMVPTLFVSLDKMPLTLNGKVDRRTLTAPAKKETNGRTSYIAPRTRMEQELAQIWAEILGLDRVGIEDDFFARGGHSLLVMRMISMIHDRLHYDLPLVKLFDNRSIAKLAKLLEQVPEQLPSSVLVEIQPRGSRAPFFCIHPIGGQVVCYVDLACELGAEQPFYAFQSPSPNSYPGPGMTIEQIATLYNREVRRVQPLGPYLLGGWSMGGLVAFEMAQQLREDGQYVGLVALFDTHLPGRQGTAIDATGAVTEGQRQQTVLARFALDMVRLLEKDFEEFRDPFLQLESEQQFTFIQETLVREGVLSQTTARDEMVNMIEAFSRNSAAMNNYFCMEPTEQPVVLFVAADAGDSDYLKTEWALQMGHDVELRQVPGDHYTMLQKPHVSVLAKLLTQLFADVQGEDSLQRPRTGHDLTVHSMGPPE